MRIPLFIYEGIEFTTVEQIEEHDQALWDAYWESEYKDESLQTARDEFGKAIDEFIYTLLHSYAVTKVLPEPAEVVEREDGDDEEEYEDEWRYELKESIARLMYFREWLWESDDEEVTYSDLEKCYQEKNVYFNSPFDKDIVYGFSYTYSPYTNYTEDDYEIFAARKVPVQKYEYKPLENFED